jgi:hypothetical protein
MLWDASTMTGYEVRAQDCILGNVQNILFEDGAGKLNG